MLTHIELADDMDPDALAGLEEFSHAEILFHFDRIPEASVERRSRHPRGNLEWPRVGILAQRGSARPNRLGATIVRILGRDGRVLRVAGLDAVDGTPVVDIKPHGDIQPRGRATYCFRRIPAHTSSDAPPAFPSVSSSSP